MKRVAARLARLEALAPVGCGACRFWGPAVYQIGDEPPDRPERCASCDRVVEIRLLRRIVLVPPGGP